MNVVEALQHSCDIFFYDVAQRLGIEKIAAMSRRFGLGLPTGIELGGEKGGLIPSKSGGWNASASRGKRAKR